MIQKLHVSKNLFDKDNSDLFFNGTSLGSGATWRALPSGTIGIVIRIPCQPTTMYTISVQGEYEQTVWNVELTSSEDTPTTNNPVSTNIVTNTKPANLTTTFTTMSTTKYILLQLSYAFVTSTGVNTIMLNSGSTALPYEPYGDTWNTKSYAKIVDTTQQVTSFPVVVRPMENTIPSWTIKGNMSQSGTPTPQNPIQPQETGERTANLLNPSNILYDTQFVTESNPPAFIHRDTLNCSNYIPVTIGTYLRTLNNVAVGNWFYEFDANKNYLRTKTPGEGAPMEISNDASYIVFNILKTVDITKYMFARTSAPLPYEPYGYKLTISSANTTTPVYLGQVQSTRNVKQIILKGGEISTVDASVGQALLNISDKCLGVTPISSHYKGKVVTAWNQLSDGECGLLNNGTVIRICDTTNVTSAPAYNQYLAAQYSAGTPVTIWYVLATETTSVVNEPLRKIGNYADSVSGTNLSVTAQSPTTIDVDTTLKPSEMDLTYTGMKMCGRKKYAGLLADNPLCGIRTYKDTLNLATGECTRQIRKLVLTGDEGWVRTQNQRCYYVNASTGCPTDYLKQTITTSICSHYQSQKNTASGSNEVEAGHFCFFTGGGFELYIGETTITSAADFKAYLQQQYAAGTPVTIWYVLATPTTETITVPSGLSGTEKGYLNQSGTPTSSNPIYPTANSVLYWH